MFVIFAPKRTCLRTISSRLAWTIPVSIRRSDSSGYSQDTLRCKDSMNVLTLKAPRKTASENVVCLCRLLNIRADFSNLFLHTGKQCGP